MSDGQNGTHPSTREYVRMVFLNKISLAGLLIGLTGALFLIVTGPDSGIAGAATYGGGMLLAGGLLFALGYTKAQRDIVDKSPDWSWKRKK